MGRNFSELFADAHWVTPDISRDWVRYRNDENPTGVCWHVPASSDSPILSVIIPTADADIPLSSLIQLALLNDEEILTSRTLWSETVLEAAHSACAKNLDLAQIILALRREALKRGVRG